MSIKLRPGYMVLPEFSMQNGVSYENGQVKPDNKQAMNEAKQITQSARHACERLLTYTGLGVYYANDRQLGALKEDLDLLSVRVKKFNSRTDTTRRITTEIYPMLFTTSDPGYPRVRKQYTAKISDTLEEIREYLLSRQFSRLQQPIRIIQNAHEWIEGPLGEMLRTLPDKIKKAQKEITHRLDTPVFPWLNEAIAAFRSAYEAQD